LRNLLTAAKNPILIALFLLIGLSLGLAAKASPEGPIKRLLLRSRATPTPVPEPPKALPDGMSEPPRYQPASVPFHEGEKLVFEASWQTIPVANARVELHRKKADPSLWSAEAWVTTNKFADVLFKMRDYLTEDVDHQSLVSQKMYIKQSENKRLNDFNATFDRKAGLVTLIKSNKKGKQVKQFISTNPLGPLSGAMLALSVPMAPGQRYSLDVFTGSTRYIFEFKVAGREKITTQLGTFDAYRLIPAVDYESDGKLSQSATGTVVWVSADNRRLPLRCESQAFIGKVRADLIQVSG
jgi:hypothetical protein